LLFSAFGLSANLSEKVLLDNDFGYLGFYMLGTSYFFSGFTALLFAAPIVDRIGDKSSFLIGAFSFSLYVYSFILPAFRSL